MDSVAEHGHAGYQALPEGPHMDASSARASKKRPGCIVPLPSSRGLIILVFIVSVLAFVAGRAGLTQRRTYVRVSRLQPSLTQELRDIHHLHNSNYDVRSRSSNPGYFSANFYKSGFIGVSRSDSSCSPMEDFTADEMVRTGLCSTRRQCRARLIVQKEGLVVRIKAGFYIYTNDGKVRTVDSETKQRMRESTAQKVRNWAVSLLSSVSSRLDEAHCTLTVDEIAEAVTEAMDTAVTCPETGDPLCEAVITIKDCDISDLFVVGGTKEEKECLAFVENSHGVESVSDLQSGCPNGDYMFSSRVGVSLPFCKSKCSPDACTKHIVYMDFYIQTNRRGDNPKDCVSSSLIPAYQLLYSTIPECDSAPFGYESEGNFIVPVVSVYQDNVPKELADLAESKGCELSYAFFVKSSTTLQEIIDASCAAK